MSSFVLRRNFLCKYIWLLNRPLPEPPRPRRVTRRPTRYSEAMIRVLAQMWEASGYLARRGCRPRCRSGGLGCDPAWRCPPSWSASSWISPRQMDRRLQPRKRTLKRRLTVRRPGTLLKHQIPIKTDHWAVHQPGYLEIDLVSHSGASASGEFLPTLDSGDIPDLLGGTPGGEGQGPPRGRVGHDNH